MISRLTLDMGNLATRRMEGMYRDVTETNVCVMEIFQKSCGQGMRTVTFCSGFIKGFITFFVVSARIF